MPLTTRNGSVSGIGHGTVFGYGKESQVKLMKWSRSGIPALLMIGLIAVSIYAGCTLKDSVNPTGTPVPKARIISLDGICTEILFALGAGADVVARDDSAYYPPEAMALPSIGTSTNTNMEAVLQLKPTLVVTVDHPMRQSQVKQLRDLNMNACITPYATNPNQAMERIRMIAEAVGRVEEGRQLTDKMGADLQEVSAKVATRREAGEKAPRVLFLLVNLGSATMLSRNSAPIGLVDFVGGVQAAESLSGATPITTEALVEGKPDVILVYADRLEKSGGIDNVLALPGVALTPAGINHRIVALDRLLLGGWGPRIGEGARELYHALYEVDGPYVSEVR